MATGSGNFLNIRTGVTTLAVAILFGFLAWAFTCGLIEVRELTPGQRQAALEKHATSLMPRGATTWFAEFYECKAVAMHPDCGMMNFGFEGIPGFDTRQHVIDSARATGWSVEDDQVTPAGYDYFVFKRKGFMASVHLEDADTAEPCLQDVPIATCTAYVDIQKEPIRWP